MMKKLYKTLLMCLILTCTGSCSGDLTYDEALEKNMKKFDNAGMVKDANFIVEMESAIMLEIRLATLAVDTGYASVVKELANQSLPDYKHMADELKTVARDANIALPDKMSSLHQSIFSKVVSSRRKNFDENFIEALKRINDDIYEKFVAMATHAHNDDIRAFAARKLDLIRAHRDRIKSTASELLTYTP